MSSFDLRRLRYFVTVAELGSVTRAAGELHIAQPALSYQIHQLEEELGVQLFARGSQGVTLTEAGRELAEESRQILGSIRALKARLSENLLGDPEGVVVVGIAQTLSLSIAVQILDSAVRNLPRVQVQIREVMSSEVPALLRSDALDFAISYSVPSGYGITSTDVFSEELYLVGTRAAAQLHFPQNVGVRDVPFRDLQLIPLTLSARSNGVRDELERLAASNKIRFNVVAEVDSMTLRKEVALSGNAFTILSAAAMRKEQSDPDLFLARIVEPSVRRQVCFVRKSGSALSRAAQHLARLCAEAFTAAAGDGSWPGTLYARDLEAAISPGRGAPDSTG